MRRSVWFYLVVLLQIVLLGTYVGYRVYWMQHGERIMLRTMPVDPRDIIRGDYVRLRYDISELDLNQIESDRQEFSRNEQVFVVLRRGDPYWQPVRLSLSRGELVPDQVALRGTVLWSNRDPATVSLEYGIENYFVPEGEGRVVEGAGEPLDVSAVVDRFGYPTIDKVYFRGEPLGLKPLRKDQ